MRIPAEWPLPDEVSTATVDVWRAYYSHRIACKKREDYLQDSDEDEYGEEEKVRELFDKCQSELEEVEEGVRGVDWTNDNGFPWFENTFIDIERYVPDAYGCNELQSATYKAIVFSPYAIPHAIELQHRYHRRARWSTMEFYATWAYSLKTYDNGVSSSNEMMQLCSNCYEDEELRADTIELDGLTTSTVDRMREHLFGTLSSKSYLDDFSFMKLIFASMATPNFETVEGEIGHGWFPDSKVSKQIVAEGIFPSEDEIKGIQWLEYEVRRVTNALRPIDKYYEPPKIQDAPGYYDDASDSD